MNSKRILSAFLVAMVLMGAFGGAAPAASGYVTATGGDSYIRTGPGLGYAQVGILYKGSSASYLGDYSYDGRGVKWYRVQHGYDTGWVSSRYTDLYQRGAGRSETGHGRETATSARAGAGLCAGLAFSIEGISASYLGDYSYDGRGVKWYRVRHGYDTGWVSSRYTDLYASSYDYCDDYDDYDYDNYDYDYDDYGYHDSGTCVEATGRVNVRSGPGLGYSDVGTLVKGEKVRYLG